MMMSVRLGHMQALAASLARLTFEESLPGISTVAAAARAQLLTQDVLGVDTYHPAACGPTLLLRDVCSDHLGMHSRCNIMAFEDRKSRTTPQTVAYRVRLSATAVKDGQFLRNTIEHCYSITP